ncbi:MAG: WGR domain-containing protein [Gammaproteobacteria bacterium]|nr:WGR domain-containing protein [Gammaproteobacteria bacterium]
MRIYMQTKYSPEQPLRFYHLHLQPDLLGGWTLVRETGLQGARGKVTKEYFQDRENAERRLVERRDTQLAKGYRVVYREGILREVE